MQAGDSDDTDEDFEAQLAAELARLDAEDAAGSDRVDTAAVKHAGPPTTGITMLHAHACFQVAWACA